MTPTVKTERRGVLQHIGRTPLVALERMRVRHGAACPISIHVARAADALVRAWRRVARA